jgi:thiol-disulfide isomerase/thioredoxin
MNFTQNFIAVAVCFLFVISSLVTPSVATNQEPDEYPNGWTHRPIMEQFTSLGCPPCMGIDPDVAKLWKEFREEPGLPVTFVSFHQINGGSDDEFASQESKDRYNHYSVQGTPDAQFDGGYIEEIGGGDETYDTYKDHYFESGERDVKPTELREDRFVFTVNLTYLGEGGISTPLNPDILDSSVYLFVVEDDIMAWSSVEEKEVLTHNVFRENALTNEQVELQAAETWTHQVEWVIPDIIDYMSGHEDHDGNAQEGEHPIPTPINPAKISVVAVVYDNDDTSRTTSSGKTGNAADTPRAANSATPETTAYDEQNEPPKVVSYDEKLNGNIAEVSAVLEDEDGIGSAYVIYNFHNGSYNDESWGVMPMQIDENNVATASIEFSSGDPVWYRILLVDGKQGFAASEAKQFEGTGSKVVEDSPGFGILAVTVALLIGLIRRRN